MEGYYVCNEGHIARMSMARRKLKGLRPKMSCTNCCYAWWPLVGPERGVWGDSSSEAFLSSVCLSCWSPLCSIFISHASHDMRYDRDTLLASLSPWQICTLFLTLHKMLTQTWWKQRGVRRNIVSISLLEPSKKRHRFQELFNPKENIFIFQNVKGHVGCL